MKVNFDGGRFSAEINEEDTQNVDRDHLTDPVATRSSIKRYLSFILGCCSLLFSFALLLLGIALGSAMELVRDILGWIPINHIAIISVIDFEMSFFAILLGVASIVTGKKQGEKSTLNLFGMVLSIVSFIVCIGTLILTLLLFIFM